MKKYLLFISCSVFVLATFFSSCNKINLPTDLGQDLIPAVDNIHTFDTTLEVETYNKIFDFGIDSARSLYTDEQFLGVMNDPIFGKTDAQMFFELKPPGYKFSFGNVPSKLTIDSVVLVLGHIETYGDTISPQNIQVSEISPTYDFKPVSIYYIAATLPTLVDRSTAYPIRGNNIPTTTVLGRTTMLPTSFKDSIQIIEHTGPDPDTLTVADQLRVRLDNSFGQRLLSYDTSGTANDAYSSDSLFKIKFKGFAVKSTAGNALMGFGLGTNTKLAIYYKYENPSVAGEMRDTTVYFSFSSGLSASANDIARNYNGTGAQILATANDEVADPIVYIQNTPGTYASIKIPQLAGLKNSIINLAELQAEQVYDGQDTLFTATPLFLDMDSLGTYKTIPYAINPSYYTPASEYSATNLTFYYLNPQGGSTGLGMFGSFPYFKKDPSGNLVKQWKFNMTRYVQHLVTAATSTTAITSFRLYETSSMMINDGNPGSVAKLIVQTSLSPKSGAPMPAAGRVRLGGGNNPTQRMKLRIVYSKL